MAVEARRKCGYRKVGGTYLVTAPGGFDCGRLPVSLVPCPKCGHEPAFTRGIQRVEPRHFLHAAGLCAYAHEAKRHSGRVGRCDLCPFDRAFSSEVAGLMWVGEKFYTPEEFQTEAAALGVSKRIPAPVPRWLEVGKTWVFLAHIGAVAKLCETCGGRKVVPGRVQDDDVPITVTTEEHGRLFADRTDGYAVRCEDCEGTGVSRKPGVFYAFVPTRLERIISDDMPQDERLRLEKQGYTLVEVPAKDPDHKSSKRENTE